MAGALYVLLSLMQIMYFSFQNGCVSCDTSLCNYSSTFALSIMRPKYKCYQCTVFSWFNLAQPRYVRMKILSFLKAYNTTRSARRLRNLCYRNSFFLWLKHENQPRAMPLDCTGQQKHQEGGKQNGGSPCNLKMTSFVEIIRVSDCLKVPDSSREY